MVAAAGAMDRAGSLRRALSFTGGTNGLPVVIGPLSLTWKNLRISVSGHGSKRAMECRQVSGTCN